MTNSCDHTFHRLGGIDDCPVCSPKEWWVDKEIGSNHALLFEPGSISEGRGFHVIEYLEYSKVSSELETLKIELELMRKERDALKAEAERLRGVLGEIAEHPSKAGEIAREALSGEKK